MTRRTTAAYLFACVAALAAVSCQEPTEDAGDLSSDQADIAPKEMVIDVEYKKLVGGKIIVKQIRPLPRPTDDQVVIPFLVARPGHLCTFQGESIRVFASHRLKADMAIDPRTVKLTRGNLDQPVLDRIDAQLADLAAPTPVQVTGRPEKLPGASHDVQPDPDGGTGSLVTDAWTLGTGATRRTYSLSMELGALRQARRRPMVVADEVRTKLSAEYDQPVPILQLDLDSNDLISGTTTEETTVLGPCPDEIVLDPTIQEREHKHGDVVIQTRFQWAGSPADDVIIIKTAPMGRFVETRITGLTTEPIVLHGYFSQTYEPGHHNFFENFIFEPALEPGISPAILQQLAAKDIRQLVVMFGDVGDLAEPNTQFFKLGASNQYEPLPD